MDEQIYTFKHNVIEEYERAKAKFPDSVCSLAALMEEVGELANALLELQFAAKKAGGTLPEDERAAFDAAIYKEAVQVAVMAARVALEGDRSLDAIQTSGAAFPSAPRG